MNGVTDAEELREVIAAATPQVERIADQIRPVIEALERFLDELPSYASTIVRTQLTDLTTDEFTAATIAELGVHEFDAARHRLIEALRRPGDAVEPPPA
jgi:hypothetical protein